MLNQCAECQRVYHSSVKTCPFDKTPIEETLLYAVCPDCGQNIFSSKFCPNDGMVINSIFFKKYKLIGKVLLDKYLVNKVRPNNQYGTVYSAKTKELDKEVTVHCFILSNFNDTFPTTIEKSKAIKHDNVVEILDYVLEDVPTDKNFWRGSRFCTYFIIEDTTNSISLEDLLKNEPLMSPERILKLFKQICLGLDFLFKNGLHPKSFSSEKIIIFSPGQKDERAKIDYCVEFPKAEYPEPPQYSIIPNPRHVSPESFEGGVVDEASIVYSLGIILYEMLTLRFPYKIDTDLKKASSVSIALKIRFLEPTPLREWDQTIPVEVDAIVMSMLSKQPKKRPLLQELCDLFDKTWQSFNLDKNNEQFAVEKKIEGKLDNKTQIPEIFEVDVPSIFTSFLDKIKNFFLKISPKPRPVEPLLKSNFVKNLERENLRNFHKKLKKRFGTDNTDTLSLILKDLDTNITPFRLTLVEIGPFAWLAPTSMNNHVLIVFNGKDYVAVNGHEIDSFSMVVKEAKPSTSDFEHLLDAFPKFLGYFAIPKIIKTQDDLKLAQQQHFKGLCLPYFQNNIYYFSVVDPCSLPASSYNVLIDWKTYNITTKKNSKMSN
jgi:serine/threonine-protein kinase